MFARPSMIGTDPFSDQSLRALEAASRGDEDRLATALARLVAEDPTVRLERRPDTGQRLLAGIEAGANLGWVQVMGPLSRIEQFKTIETSSNFFGLQQVRWSPTNIADTAEEALARMFMVFEGGDQFGALLSGAEEVPAVMPDARAVAQFVLNSDGSLSYELRATGPIQNATA